MSFAPTPPLKRSSIYTYRKEAPRISSSTTASSVTALASAVFTPDQEPAAKRVAIDERNTLQDLPFEIFAKIWTPERISGGHF